MVGEEDARPSRVEQPSGRRLRFLFESGSIDRYLPLFPLLFLALSMSLSGDRSALGIRGMALAFVVVMIGSNLSAMSVTTLNRVQAQVATRIQDLEPLLTGQSRVVTVNQQGEVYAFNQNSPFHPINRSGRLDADILVDPNSTHVPRWRRIFAMKTLAIWDSGGDVWITTRVLHRRPRPEWNWVEGDDPARQMGGYLCFLFSPRDGKSGRW